jgi:uncharacterized repeat protein (TIGR02543 family)
MKQFYYTFLLTGLLFLTSNSSHAAKSWIDVTSQYVTNADFSGNSNTGWTFKSNGGSNTVRCEAMEFWNGTFDVHQTVKSLPQGQYRLSVQGYYRCGDNSSSYQDYRNGSETIPAYLYAGSTQHSMASIYSQSFSSNLANSCWAYSSGRSTIYFPNTMESARVAFDQSAYQNSMTFTHSGGDVNIGIANSTYNNSNWCIFTNFKLEVYAELVPVTSITPSATSLSMILGESKQLSATVLPANATIPSLTWSSSDTNVAIVDANGLVTSAGEGTANITAQSTDGSNVKCTIPVTVTRHDATAASLIINEIMAGNVDEYVSPAYNFDGWVEIYNPTDEAAGLAGLYLSDNTTNLKQWRMPNTIGVIPAKGFRLLWLDSNEVNANNATFKLDTDGGTLYVSDANGNLITSATFPACKERVSYARTTDAGDTWAETAYPTPGYTNVKSTFSTSQLAAPVVDQGSQLFSSSLSVQVTIPTGATLRYTTDGTLPTLTNGTTSATGKFTVSATTNYRFRLFQDGSLPSNVTTRSYLLRNKDYALPVISVVGDPNFLYSDSLGVMVQGKNGVAGNGKAYPCNWNMEWDRPVNFSYLTADGQMALNQDVNLEMCGGWSRAFTPHSFKLKGDKELGGNKNLPYPFFSAKPYIRNRTLQIRNGGNDNYCRIKDAALQTICQTSGIDIDCQSYQPVHEFINGKYIGVLNMREPNNKHYVYANYGWDDDQIDQFEINPDSGYVQMCGTVDAFNRLYDLSATAANSDTYAEIQQQLDIDEYINYMAMEMYLGSTDWPQNNVKGFRYLDGGKFRLVTLDLDFAFNTSDVFNLFDYKNTYTFDQLYNGKDRITAEIKFVTIFRNLLKNENFRRRFIDTYSIMGGSVFESTRATAIIDSLTAIVTPQMALNNESPAYTANDMKTALSTRNSTMMTTLQKYSPMYLSSATKCSATLKSNVDGARILINGIDVPTGSFMGTLFSPMKIQAVAPAGYTFKGWRNANNAIYSTDAEIDMPSSDFTLTATYQATANATAEGFTPVRINEISAANDVFVNDYGKKTDWVELYNTTAKAQDVEGMYLSDDATNLTKSQLSKGSTNAVTVIPAHGYLIVWCDKNKTSRNLHTSFKLAGEGGIVALTSADKTWTDSITYPAHDAYTSIGRYVDGGNTIYSMNKPTPGSRNLIGTYTTKVAEQTKTGIVQTVAAQTGGAQLTYAAGQLILRGNITTATINIYTLSGQQITSITVNLNHGCAFIPVTMLNSGCYIAKATDGQGHTATCKFLK